MNIKNSDSILNRYSNPTRFDIAPYRTIWKVIVSDDESYHYIQTNENEEKPEWIRINNLLEKAFAHFYENSKFIEHCIKLYKKKDDEIVSPITICGLTSKRKDTAT